MSSIKQLIVNAIIKVSGENPALNGIDQPTADQARDDFIRLLLAELFPEDPSVPVAKTPVVKEKKAKKPKAKVEPVVVEKVAVADVADVSVPDVAPAPESVPVAEAAAPLVEPETKQETPKKKRAPMSDEAKAAMKAKKEATLAAKKAGGEAVSPSKSDSVLETSADVPVAVALSPPVKEKKAKKEKVVVEVNLKKVDPTWKKHLKNADKEHAKELEAPLLTYLNALSKEDFDGKKAEEHVASFIASRAPKPVADPEPVAVVVDEKVDAELVEIEFEKKTYYVNAETKRVYEGEGEYDEEVGWTNYKPVGYVGMAIFEKMSLDE